MTTTTRIPTDYTLYTHNVYRDGGKGERYQIAANLTDASAPIYTLGEDGDLCPTGLQTADVRHDPSELRGRVAAIMVGE